MKTIYLANDGTEFDNTDDALAQDKLIQKRERERSSKDFEFMALCHAKGNPAMYELFRDRRLDKE
jgi:hypothetical protein